MFNRVYLFHVLNSMVMVLFADVFANRLGDIWDRPAAAAGILGGAILPAASFFVNYIMLKGTSMAFFKLLNTWKVLSLPSAPSPCPSSIIHQMPSSHHAASS